MSEGQTQSLSVVRPLNIQKSWKVFLLYLVFGLGNFGRILALVKSTEALLPIYQGQVFAGLVLHYLEDE